MDKVKKIWQYHPYIIGFLSALFCGIILYWLGNISEYKAKKLIEESISNFGMLFNTITLASATILALLLTAIGSSRSAEVDIKKDFYQQIMQLTTVVSLSFVLSLFSFQIILIPLTENSKFSMTFYDNLYWTILIISSILTGIIISVALMLRLIIKNIINLTVLQKEDHEMRMTQEEKDELNMND